MILAFSAEFFDAIHLLGEFQGSLGTRVDGLEVDVIV